MTESPLRLLVVDDDEVDRMAVRRALRASGEACELAEAVDASSAMTALVEGAFDCAFLDYQLPDGDGLGVLRRAREAGVSTPIVMLTGFGDEQVAVELMKAGASDYLSKSALSPERLRRSLRYAIRLREAEAVARRTTLQLRGLSDTALAIQTPLDPADRLRVAAEHARRLLDARFIAALVRGGGGAGETLTGATSADARYAAWAPAEGDPGMRECAQRVASGTQPIHVSRARLAEDPAFVACRDLDPSHPMHAGWIAAPLRGRHGEALGVLCAADCVRGEFTDGDEAILAQLAQLVSVALENARLYDEARAASRARDDILAVVSHDLRNPVGAIQVAADFLLGTAPDDDRRSIARRQLEVIRRAAVSALRLIQDLMDVTRIDAGRLVLERAAEDPARLVHEAAERAAPLAQAARLAVAEEITPGLPRVDADAERVLQVLDNLAGNAIKFTSEGGRITIGAMRHADGTPAVRFFVRDTGAGIPPEDLPHVFDRFWQARGGARRGAGLGLAIVRGIVEAHGGRVWVESSAGTGTMVAFTLPVGSGVGIQGAGAPVPPAP